MHSKDEQRAKRSVDQRCNTHILPGQCPLTTPKYIFNKDSRVCQQKSHGDCAGDEDLFDSESECRIACLQKWFSNVLEYSFVNCLTVSNKWFVELTIWERFFGEIGWNNGFMFIFA